MKLRMLDEDVVRHLDRRALLRALGMGLAVVPLTKVLAACGGDEAATTRDTGEVGAGDVTSGETTAEVAAETTADAPVVVGWATGGTAAMTAAASYPDPFSGAAPSSCELQCEMTIGPCHVASPERRDVSEGADGLPVRLALQVVDAACAPIAGAVVEIWHTNYAGVYSGELSVFCNTTDEERAAQFFRGYQVTDAAGRVDFDTCFPGWYRGRAVHIHFRVQTGAYAAPDDAAAVVISQLFFDDAILAEVFSAAPRYADFGEPNVSNAEDNIFRQADDPAPYTLATARMSDGAMQAYKRLIVRTSTTTDNCTL